MLKAVADLSGGWKRGPVTAPDGTKRARGVAMASAWGTQTAVRDGVCISKGGREVGEKGERSEKGRRKVAHRRQNTRDTNGRMVKRAAEAIRAKMNAGGPVSPAEKCVVVTAPVAQ
ncbi:hypothetical protein B1218_38395 [Pseudomonas ogarae]|nr:hypothetical protein B1218_38395 [Pseudomonas ogarae]